MFQAINNLCLVYFRRVLFTTRTILVVMWEKQSELYLEVIN